VGHGVGRAGGACGMSPETLIIDREFRGVGRIKRATGSLRPDVRKRQSKMLTVLYEDGRLDILRAIRDGALSLAEVHAAYQRKALDSLPTAETVRPLAVAMQSWIDGLIIPREVSKKHKQSLETSRRYFAGERAKASIADLPAVLESLRTTLGKKHPRSFNLARAAALAYVRATLKKSHPLWLACAAVEVCKLAKGRTHAPLSPDQMRAFFPKPESDPVDAIAWGMATTGMGAAEYWGRWSVQADRVHIEGTKRDARVRDVPLVMRPAVPSMHRRTFENKVRDRSTAFTVYDLRRTFANWMESASIPRTRRKLYLGHAAGDVTGMYELHEVREFLAADAAKLRALLKLHHPEGHTMTLHTSKGA
jgi:integrase